MNLFWASLTPELRSVVAQQDQQTMTIRKMYDVVTTAQREGKDSKKLAIINEVKKDLNFQPELEEDKNDIAAFSCQPNNQGGAQPKIGGQAFQGNQIYQNAICGGQQNFGST
jgi:hypothetical protein